MKGVDSLEKKDAIVMEKNGDELRIKAYGKLLEDEQAFNEVLMFAVVARANANKSFNELFWRTVEASIKRIKENS